MSNREHALRNLALKLNVSGTAEVLDEQRLYKGSYGFVKLQVYAPKTQNTEAPMCTVFCTTTDRLGREKISSKNHSLLYAGEFELDGASYLLFEQYLPKEFTETATYPDGLKLTINYYDTAVTKINGETVYDANGVPKRHATDLLVSSRYTTTVYEGGWNNDDVELNINAAEAAQIGVNMRDIAELQSDVAGIRNYSEQVLDETKTAANEIAKNTAKTTAVSAIQPYVEETKRAQTKAEAAQNAAEQAKKEAERFSNASAQSAQNAAEQADRAKIEAVSARQAQTYAEQAKSEIKATATATEKYIDKFIGQAFMRVQGEKLIINPIKQSASVQGEKLIINLSGGANQ